MAKTVSRHSRKYPIWIIFFLLVIVAAAIILIVFQPFKNQPAPAPESPATVVQTDNSRPDNTIASPDSSEQQPSSEAPAPAPVENPKHIVQNEGADPNASPSITGVITRANVSGNNLVIRLNIDQYLSSGSCELTLTSGAKKYTDSANIVAEASTSTCAGFDVPVSELAGGVWNISIQISSGDKQGIINGEVSL